LKDALPRITPNLGTREWNLSFPRNFNPMNHPGQYGPFQKKIGMPPKAERNYVSKYEKL